MNSKLQAVKDRIAAATPRPWAVDDCIVYEPDSNGPDMYRGAAPKSYTCSEYSGGIGVIPEKALSDADLIAHAPADLARLIQVVEIYEKYLNLMSPSSRTTAGIAAIALAEADKVFHE